MKNRIPMELHFKNTKKVFLVLGVILGSKNVEFGMKVWKQFRWIIMVLEWIPVK